MKPTNTMSRWHSHLRSGRQAGFTLIEMMIAITIGLGILAGLVGVLASSSSNSRSNDRTSELMTNGRYALNSMKQELRQAGFRGYTWAEPGTPGALALGNECLQTGAAAGGFVGNIRQGIWGANDVNPFAANCIPAANYAAGNDVVAVRRLAATSDTALDAGTVYFHSTYDRGQIFQGTTPPVFGGSPAPAPLASFPVQAYVYYVSPFTVSATETPLVPALYRVALQNDGSMARELVASGIERLQVQYGRLATDLSTQYVNAGTAPLDDTSFVSTGTAWDDVNAVRIWLLARTSATEPGYSNTSTYVMGDQSFTVADGFRRQVFTTVVQLRN